METHAMRHALKPLFLILSLALVSTQSGCFLNEHVINPAFITSEKEAQADERRMRSDLKTLDRPVLIVGGYHSPDIFVESMAIVLRRMTSDDRNDFIRQPTWFDNDIKTVAADIVKLVDAEFPSPNDTETIEVDVVALSMGGLAARYAADRLQAENPGSRKLKINRLFTLATPHRGAVLSDSAALVEDRAVTDMVRRSLFLTKLQESYQGDYEIVPYVRLKDGVVGAINAAPYGRTPIWVSAPKYFGGSHLGIPEDLRLLTDIARRLRGETPKSTEGEPLPDSEYGKK